MDDSIDKLVSKFLQEGENTVQFYQNLPNSVWDTSVYSDGAQWTIKQILAHQVEAEWSILKLVENILDGGEGVPEDFDLNRYNERKVGELDDLSPDELLTLFTQRRKETVAKLKTMTSSDLEKEGRHPWLGYARIEDMLKLMYRHNKIHQREIRQALSSLGKRI